MDRRGELKCSMWLSGRLEGTLSEQVERGPGGWRWRFDQPYSGGEPGHSQGVLSSAGAGRRRARPSIRLGPGDRQPFRAEFGCWGGSSGKRLGQRVKRGLVLSEHSEWWAYWAGMRSLDSTPGQRISSWGWPDPTGTSGRLALRRRTQAGGREAS